MPSSKPTKPAPVPPAAVKKPMRGAVPIADHVPVRDEQSEAREARTREFLRAESRREAELTKAGYCF